MAPSTVSAFTENDTYIDIAKVEGSETYKAYMLHESQQQDLTQFRYCPFSEQLCQQFWPVTAQPPNPVAPILHVLVGAAAALLERPVDSVYVSIHGLDRNRWDRFEADVQSALDSIHVHSWDRLGRILPEQDWALGLGGRCSYYDLPHEPGYVQDPAKIILGVEYTRQSLTASLWEEECRIYSRLQAGPFASGPGSDAREACLNRNPSNDSDGQAYCDDLFKSELRNLLRNSSRGTGNGNISAIDLVFLTGERANDESMKSLLSQVLEELYTQGGSLDLSLMQKFSPDPAFAGSRSAAYAERGAKLAKRAREAGDPRDIPSDLTDCES
jgi:hypothetical protein